jgi:8-oxo-dGTP diphosphatase
MGNVSHDSETPASGQQVLSVAAFIHHTFSDGTRIFMPRRAKTKKFLPNVLELPGGHVNFGEQMIDGLRREIQEELQMSVRIGDPFAVFTYMNEVKGSHSIEVVYFAEFVEALENIHLNAEDHSEYLWIGEADVDSIVAPNKQSDDPEIQAIERGFELLAGGHIHF